MTNYRRWRIEGGTYFFTVALEDRGASTLIDHVDLLRKAFGDALAARPVRIDTIVILPDHLHTIWTLPARDSDYSTRWKLIKTGFTRALLQRAPDIRRSPSRSKRERGEKGIWQRRFWEHTVRNSQERAALQEYCWFNPVKHDLARRVRGWPHSSFHREVRRGVLPADWAGEAVDGQFGEPKQAVGWVGTHPTQITTTDRSGTGRKAP